MRNTPNDLVLSLGDECWSLHAPGATNSDIKTGRAPYILYGEGAGPTLEERQLAFQMWIAETSR